VDLSAGMLRRAAAKGIYDALHEEDIVAFLRKHEASFDLIVLADVLIYMGDVRELVAAMRTALRRSGRVAMSVERLAADKEGLGVALQPSGRYQHSMQYLERLLCDGGFAVNKVAPCALREEHGRAVEGCIVVAGR